MSGIHVHVIPDIFFRNLVKLRVPVDGYVVDMDFEPHVVDLLKSSGEFVCGINSIKLFR